jgi:uncharacterized protein (DUF2141 family)
VGTYQAYIRDAANTSCVASVGVVQDVTEPDALTADVAHTDITCNGSNNGTVTISNADGGYGTYEYQLNDLGWQSTGTFTGLSVGTYQAYIRDAANTSCVASVGVVQDVTEPSAVTSSTSKVNISKNGETDGVLNFTEATGGTHGETESRTFQYYIVKNGTTTFGPQSSTSFTGLGAGAYTTFVIAEASGSSPACTTQVTTRNILEPSAVMASIAKTNISCNGSPDGSITVSGTTGGTHGDVGSGTRTYRYTIARANGSTTGPQASGSFTGLIAGTYTVSVTALVDGVYNPASTTVLTTSLEIFEPSLVETSATMTSSNPTCFGATNGSIDVQGGTGGIHGDIEERDYRYTIVKVEGSTTGPQTSTSFTGLGAGTYNVFITTLQDGNNPACTTNVGQVILTQPTAITHTLSDNANLSAPYVKNGGTVTLTLNVQGGTPRSSLGEDEAHYNVEWTTLPTGVTITDAANLVSSVGNTDGSYTITYEITSVDPDVVTGMYHVIITDGNSCPSSSNGTISTMVNVYATVDLYVDNINGSNSSGTGSSAYPLASITKAIDVASALETINVMQASSGSTPYDEGTEGPIITKNLTFKSVDFTYDGSVTPPDSRYSGITQLSVEPTFATNKAFVLATTDVTFTGFSPSAMYVQGSTDGQGTIQVAIDRVASPGTVTLLAGTWNLSGPLTISRQLTLQGMTPTNTGCGLNPTAQLNVAGTTKLMLFSGTSVKNVNNLTLQVGKDPASTTTGRFFEIQSGSSGNVNATNIIFQYNNGTSTTRMFGVTNADYSAGVLNDVAKFVNDVTDAAGFGTGKVNYGNQAPLPLTNLEIGWKSEDAGTATNNAGVLQVYPMIGTTQLRPGTTTTRPLFKTAANGIGGRAAVEFNGTARYLAATATTGIVSGSAKSVFVAFKTPNVDIADGTRQVIYKHGNHETGMSIVLVGTTSTTTESVILSVYSNATPGNTATQKAVSKTFTAAKNTAFIGQLYFDGGSTNRVGVALDKDDAQVGEQVWGNGDFDVTSLASPTIGVAMNVSVGAKSGSVRYGTGNTVTTDYNTTAGLGLYFGSTDGGQVGEVLVYNTAAKETRDAIYCYLRNKFLTTSSVDNNLEKRNNDDNDVVAGGDVEFVDEMDVYPNPAESELSITVAAKTAGRLKVELVDALGRVVNTMFNEFVSQNTVLPIMHDVSGYASGTYMVRVTGAGDMNMSQPVIIRR